MVFSLSQFWLRLSIRYKGAVVTALPIVCLGIVLMVSSVLNRRVELAEQQVKRTQEIHLQSEQILRLLVDAETGVRGYLLTGQSTFLEPYVKAHELIPDTYRHLEQLVQDPEQLAQLQVIRELITQKTTLLQDRISLVGDTVAAGDRPISTPLLIQDKRVMDTLREAIGEFIEGEEALLTQRQNYLEAERNLSRVVLWLAGVVGIVGGVAANYLYAVSIVRRIEGLQRNAGHVAAGEPLTEPVAGEDELSHLDQALYATARQIAQKQADLREANLRIAEAARKERALIDNSLDLICSIDAEGKFVKVSPACVDLLGYQPEELIGRRYMELVLPDDAERTTVVATEIMAGKPTSGFENRYSRKNGSQIDILWSAVWSETEQLMYCVWRDNTKRKEIERLKNEFVGIVSHELRTPLTSLRGFTEILLRKNCTPEKQRQYLTIMQSESKRLTDLINDFLDIQRIESGRQNYEFASVDLTTLIHETVSLFSESNKLHQFQVDVPEQLSEVKADSDRIRQVLSNLISNAVKYSPEGGEIRVSAVEQETAVCVSVSDRGIGMAPEAMQGLFQKFYRIDNASTRKIGGTGLGLVLVKEIIEAHDGQVWAESTPGQGSVFSFTLRKAVLVPTTVNPSRLQGQAIDILIIEDDVAFTELLREHLRHTNLQIVSTPFAEQALQLIQERSPRLVFLDILLAGEMDGWDFLIALRRSRKLLSLPVMVITMTEPNVRGLALKGADYLPKPVEPDVLQQTVQYHVPHLSGKTVLIADDDPAFRQQIMASLQAEDSIHFKEAANGREALEIIRLNVPDLLILDLILPELDGFEVVQQLREDKRTLNLPVLVVTGIDLSHEEKTYLSNRMATLVNKQVASIEALSRQVERILSVFS